MDVLTLKNITKGFNGVTVLDDISFSIRQGEVHALLGENGAGKSTLIKIVGGIYQREAGTIEFCGGQVNIKNINEAKALGISIIHQEISLCSNLSVAANIVLGNECGRGGLLSDAENIEFARKAIAQVDDTIDVTRQVSTLTIAQQQITEIAKAIAYNAKVVIMDEPTSSLSEAEVKNLYRVVEILKKNGVAILYVSHRMEEIFDLSDRITVLRDGKMISTVDTKEAKYDDLIQMLVGREIEDIYPHSDRVIKDTALEVNGLTREGYFEDISINVKHGEIVGLYGLIGAGRSEVAQVIYGVEKGDAGTVKVLGKEYQHINITKSMKKGLALIPESRKEQGIVEVNSINFNASLCILDKFNSVLGLKKTSMNSMVLEYLKKLKVKMESPLQCIANLSGGNQQKVVIAKMLATNPQVLILDEPTRGIDIGAKAEIYTLIDELAKQGVAILMISSELPEIINLSNRVYVMREGKLTFEAVGEDINQENIMKYAIGGR